MEAEGTTSVPSQPPRTSISCCLNYEVPLDVQLPLIAAAGFTNVSLSRPDHARYLTKDGRQGILRSTEECGLQIDTIHAPSIFADGGRELVRETIAAAGELTVPVVVLHPTPFEVDQGDRSWWCRRFTDEYLDDLTASARASGVRVALENLCPGPAVDVLLSVLARAPRDVFGFCYDSSHDQIDGPRPPSLVRKLADRLLAVHISDRVAPFRDHRLPGDGFVDFDEVCRELGDAGYAGPLLLELMTTETRTPALSQFLHTAHESALALARKVLEYRRA